MARSDEVTAWRNPLCVRVVKITSAFGSEIPVMPMDLSIFHFFEVGRYFSPPLRSREPLRGNGSRGGFFRLFSLSLTPYTRGNLILPF